MARNDPQVPVRLPPDVKAFIEAEAQENASSKNSEIVRAIRAAMKAKGVSEFIHTPRGSDNFQNENGAASAATDPRHVTINP